MRGKFPVRASLHTSDPEVTISRSCVCWCLFWCCQIYWNLQFEFYFLHILKGTLFVLNSAFSKIMLFSGENCAEDEWFLEKWTLTRDWSQAKRFYLYTGQMGTSSHSLSSYKVSGHACPPLAESWRIILYRDCLTAVVFPVKQKKELSFRHGCHLKLVI